MYSNAPRYARWAVRRWTARGPGLSEGAGVSPVKARRVVWPGDVPEAAGEPPRALLLS